MACCFDRGVWEACQSGRGWTHPHCGSLCRSLWIVQRCVQPCSKQRALAPARRPGVRHPPPRRAPAPAPPQRRNNDHHHTVCGAAAAAASCAARGGRCVAAHISVTLMAAPAVFDLWCGLCSPRDLQLSVHNRRAMPSGDLRALAGTCGRRGTDHSPDDRVVGPSVAAAGSRA